MSKDDKTNVMRLLEQKKVAYTPHSYPHEDGVAVDGATVAALIGRDPGDVFKTLVAVGASKGHYVFVIPVEAELDLKKAARAAGEKSVAMLPLKELTPLTGYVRGGCSPVGMKKAFPTFFHRSAQERPAILVSAGRIGSQVEVEPETLCRLVRGQFADLVKEP